MKKLSTFTRNIGRCTELRFKWLEMVRKSGNLHVPVEPKLALSSGSEVSVV